MEFHAVSRGQHLSPKTTKAHVTLERNGWDDFGIKSLYSAVYFPAGSESTTDAQPIGDVKILQVGLREGRAPLPNVSNGLNDSYFSLGQSIHYYDVLQDLSREVRTEILVGLQDAVFTDRVAPLSDEPSWGVSLLRFGAAGGALDHALMLYQQQVLDSDRMRFTYRLASRGEAADLPVTFDFDDSTGLPGRCNVLIGYNGSGKTRLLGQLARSASGFTDDFTDAKARLSGDTTRFGGVVAVSYSAFDNFRLPSKLKSQQEADTTDASDVFGYTYCGLRKFDPRANNVTNSALKSIDDLTDEFSQSLSVALERDSEQLAVTFGLLSREPSFGRAGVELQDLTLSPEQAVDSYKRLSTGHKITLNIVTQLAAHLQPRSLVLIDEPETHLHPPLIAALLKAIQHLLTLHKSYSIIATHSPVIVQEVPARFVQVIGRVGNTPDISAPKIETYGESISPITHMVFSLDSSATDFQGVLRDLAATKTLEEIEALFEPYGLSAQGRAYLLQHLRRRRHPRPQMRKDHNA